MDNNLQHYGILGMRWGRRKGRVSALGRGTVGVVAKYNQALANHQYKKSKKLDADAYSVESQRDILDKLTKNGKPLFKEGQVDAIIKNYKDRSSKMASKAKQHQQLATSLLKEIGQLKMKDIKQQ